MAELSLLSLAIPAGTFAYLRYKYYTAKKAHCPNCRSEQKVFDLLGRKYSHKPKEGNICICDGCELYYIYLGKRFELGSITYSTNLK